MKRLFILLLAALMIAVVGCGSDDDASGSDNEKRNETENTESEGAVETPEDITFGAATVGGVWYTLAGAMGDEMSNVFPDSSVTVVEGGSTANLLGLGDGTFDVAYSNGEAISEANEGTGEFDEPINNFSTIATLYPNPLHIVARADSDIYTIEDLKGKKVSPGIKGYSGEITFQRILDIAGMSYDDLGGIEYIGTEDAANLLRDNHIDAWVGVLAPPAATWEEFDTTVGMRLIPLDDEVVDEMYAQNSGYLPFTIEESTYPNQDEDAQTVAPFTVMLVNNDTLSEDDVYELTKMVVENNDAWATVTSTLDNFDAEYTIENSVGEMHPGAEKYYKEIGVME